LQDHVGRQQAALFKRLDAQAARVFPTVAVAGRSELGGAGVAPKIRQHESSFHSGGEEERNHRGTETQRRPTQRAREPEGKRSCPLFIFCALFSFSLSVVRSSGRKEPPRHREDKDRERENQKASSRPSVLLLLFSVFVFSVSLWFLSSSALRARACLAQGLSV
jgi:hypothetical protein